MGSDKFAVKKMEVCEICGAFLIVGDAQSRIGISRQHIYNYIYIYIFIIPFKMFFFTFD